MGSWNEHETNSIIPQQPTTSLLHLMLICICLVSSRRQNRACSPLTFAIGIQRRFMYDISLWMISFDTSFYFYRGASWSGWILYLSSCLLWSGLAYRRVISYLWLTEWILLGVYMWRVVVDLRLTWWVLLWALNALDSHFRYGNCISLVRIRNSPKHRNSDIWNKCFTDKFMLWHI